MPALGEEPRAQRLGSSGRPSGRAKTRPAASAPSASDRSSSPPSTAPRARWAPDARSTRSGSRHPRARSSGSAACLLDVQSLLDLHARQIRRQVQGQFADRFRTGIGPAQIAGRRALAKLSHPLGILRSARRLDRAAVGAAFPALDLDPAGDFVDMGRLGIVAQIEPPVPHVPLAESPNDLVGRLINADRQIAVAQAATLPRRPRLARSVRSRAAGRPQDLPPPQ